MMLMGSREPLWPHILIAVIATLVLLVLTFNYQLVAALKDFASTDYASSCPSPSPFTIGLPSTKTLFHERSVLDDLSPSADEVWERTALTRKGGYLWVEFNETANEAWGISMFHALHCLKMLRLAVRSSGMVKSVAGSGFDSNGNHGKGTLNHPDMDPVHIGHCIGYIAQV
jgi:hypothetical protein